MAKSKRKTKRDIDAFIAALEKECGESLEELAATVLKDRKTRPAFVMRLMEYIYGKPKELVSHSGSITVYDAVAKARARVLQFEQARKSKETPQLLEVLPERIS